MTVGRTLADRIDYPLFHNHISIEVALRFFDFGTEGFNRISSTIRKTVFDTIADSQLPGLIFTWAWAFNEDDDRITVEWWTNRWIEKTSGQVYFLELAASEEARRERNRHPDRLAEKPSKRDIGRSEKLRRAHDTQYQFNSDGAFPLAFPHLCVDNTQMLPDQVADAFLESFDLGSR